MIYRSYPVKAFAWLKSYLYLWPYSKKGFSAGGTFWSGTYRAGCLLRFLEFVLGDFLGFLAG